MANETELAMLRHEVSTVTEHTYTLKDEVSIFYYKEWMDEKGNLVDSLMRDRDGHEIDDPVLQHRVWELIDKYENKTK